MHKTVARLHDISMVTNVYGGSEESLVFNQEVAGYFVEGKETQFVCDERILLGTYAIEVCGDMYEVTSNEPLPLHNGSMLGLVKYEC